MNPQPSFCPIETCPSRGVTKAGNLKPHGRSGNRWKCTRCGHTFSGRRYYGIYKSAMTYLWDPCAGCEATGRTGSEVCRECAGFGWKLYA